MMEERSTARSSSSFVVLERHPEARPFSSSSNHNLEASLKQMRLRRYSAFKVQAAELAAAKDAAEDNDIGGTSAAACWHRRDSYASYNSITSSGGTGGSSRSLNTSNHEPKTESEYERGVYWKRLSDQRKNTALHKQQEFVPSSSSPASPTSVFGMKEILERELISKLQGLQESLLTSTTTTTSSQQPPPPHRRSSSSSVKFGKHEEKARELEYTNEDLHHLVDHQEFLLLQRSLRNKGAVTNELLKQVLPFVVKQSLERRQKRLTSVKGGVEEDSLPKNSPREV